MTSTPDNNDNSSRVAPRTDKPSLCFRAPGGRIGLPRLSGVAELLRVTEDVSVMITRRQALVVRASFDNLPSYLHEELESHDISAPNIKSYPLPVTEHDSNPIVRSLENELEEHHRSTSLSYSPTPRFRSELIQDDVCVQRRDDHDLKVTTTKWSDEPTTLVDNVSPRRWAGLVDGIKEIITDESGGNRSLRDVKRLLTKAINNVAPREAHFGAEQWIDEEKIINTDVTGNSRFPSVPINNRPEHWLLITVPGGHLSPEDLSTIIEVARTVSANELHLTPEQNIVLPVPTDHLSHTQTKLSEQLSDKLLGTPYRVSTCPGSQFCVNAEYDSVQLARRLYRACNEHAELASFNGSHSVVIASCGDTQNLERQHPVALVPSSEPSMIDVYMGGSPHGLPNPGILVKQSVSKQNVIDTIVKFVNNFRNSSYQSLRNWAEEHRAPQGT